MRGTSSVELRGFPRGSPLGHGLEIEDSWRRQVESSLVSDSTHEE